MTGQYSAKLSRFSKTRKIVGTLIDSLPKSTDSAVYSDLIKHLNDIPNFPCSNPIKLSICSITWLLAKFASGEKRVR